MTSNVSPNREEHPFSLKRLSKRSIESFRFRNLQKRSWRTKFAVLVVFFAVISCILTYAAITETPPLGDNPDLVLWLLNVDLFFLLLLVFLIAKRIVAVWSGHKRGVAGSHLHIRFVYIFSALVAVPTIIMTVFSVVFFYYGVQAWFSQRVQTAINESQAVAQSYLEEHKAVIRADTIAMANDLGRQADYFVLNSENLPKALDTQSFFRNLSEAIVVTSKKRVLARSSLAFSLEYEIPEDYQFTQAAIADAVLFMNEERDRVRALVKLDGFDNAYLFVGRMIDPEVLQHLQAAQLATEDYQNLQDRYADFQITVTSLFIVVGLLLLLAAIWSGLLIARELVNPIGELIKAADRVSAGDLTSRLSDDVRRLEEFDHLAKSFNRMTDQLQNQRTELLDANRQIDRRRLLTETVLAGVSSGVIGVDKDGSVNLANHSAAELLFSSVEEMTGRYIFDVFPEIQELLEQIKGRRKKSVNGEIHLTSQNQGKRVFLCRISVERLEDQNTGLIITFDDITEIQAAQRTSAWSDVARRIAHEIKNPLTPIQLSAERLKRKYLKQIEDDPDTFSQCTDTIIRNVTDIGRMVDEFSSFARMPEPVLKCEDINKPLTDTLFLLKQAHADIAFSVHHADDLDTSINIDSRQIRQVFTNLLQNAVEAIQGEEKRAGNVDIFLGDYNGLYIAICDDGPGFVEDEDVSKLTDPYVTHKEKGTGLGLAIVKKIMEDHGGKIILGRPQWLNAEIDTNGACVVLVFPVGVKETEGKDE